MTDLKTIRTGKKISLRQASKLAGVSPTFWSMLENNHSTRPSIETALRIFESLQCNKVERACLVGLWSKPLVDEIKEWRSLLE